MSGGLVTRAKVTTLDKIRKYYLKGENSVVLTPKQDKIRLNVFKAWNLLVNYHTPEQAMQTMMNLADDGEGCARATAYRYVSDAMICFGNPALNLKEAKKVLADEFITKAIQRAIKNKDGDLEDRLLGKYIKLHGLDKDAVAVVDPNKLKAQTYVLKLHPSVIAKMEANSNGGVVDFNSHDTEDIDFEDLTEDTSDE